MLDIQVLYEWISKRGWIHTVWIYNMLPNVLWCLVATPSIPPASPWHLGGSIRLVQNVFSPAYGALETYWWVCYRGSWVSSEGSLFPYTGVCGGSSEMSVWDVNVLSLWKISQTCIWVKQDVSEAMWCLSETLLFHFFFSYGKNSFVCSLTSHIFQNWSKKRGSRKHSKW